MEKSPDAFRTISEVAEWLEIPTHVLRFWESRFSQIKPVKRAGGRRYYRPADMRLIGGVKTLLHDQGMTIRDVQKVLREQGIKHVSSFSRALDSEAIEVDVIEHEASPAIAAAPAPAARETHFAEPAAEPDQGDASEEAVAAEDSADAADAGEPDQDQPDMFSDQISETSEDAPAAVGVEVAASASIPDTPDVPDEDIEDDAPGYASEPGIAARLAAARMSELAGHRTTLVSAKERLLSLRDRIQ